MQRQFPNRAVAMNDLVVSDRHEKFVLILRMAAVPLDKIVRHRFFLQLFAVSFKKFAVLVERVLLEHIIQFERITRLDKIQKIRRPEIKESENERNDCMRYDIAFLLLRKLRDHDDMHRFVILRESRELGDLRKA